MDPLKSQANFASGNIAAAAAVAAAFGFGGSPMAALQHLQQQAQQARANRSNSFDGGTLGVSTGSSPLSIPLEYTPETAEAKLVDYRNEKVAAFEVDGDTMICLPQAYDLFLKHLVGGLHTVYTKLKRLEITPFVCNVEQVRALRSIGAIQPGVNRCKLISCKDFDILFEDCASSSSRPGRPPKRSPLFSPSIATTNDFFSLKRPKMSTDATASFGKLSAPSSTMNPISNFVNSGQFNPNLFPLFPFTPQQMMMSHLPNLLVRQWSDMQNGTIDDPDSDHEQKIDVEETHRSVGSAESADPVVNLSKLTKDNSQATGAIKPQGPLTTNGRLSGEDEDHDHNNSDSDEQSDSHRHSNNAPNLAHSFNSQAFNFANVFVPNDGQRRSSLMPRAEDVQYSSVQNLLLSVMGLIEVAAATARKQEEQLIKEKLEIYKAFDEEKQERTRVEKLLREEQRAKTIYLKRWRHAKRQKNDMQNQVITMLEQRKQQQTTPQQNISKKVPTPILGSNGVQQANHGSNGLQQNNHGSNGIQSVPQHTSHSPFQQQQPKLHNQQPQLDVAAERASILSSFRSPLKEERS